MAAYLREELKDNEPCPVCGSTHHEKIYVTTNFDEAKEVEEKIKKLDVKAICVEPQYSTKAAETISKETNVKVYTLDPIVTEESKNSSYIDIMNKNLETLKEAFK